MNRHLLVFAVAAIFAVAPLHSDAQDNVTFEPFNIESLSCWDVITLPEDDATFVTALLIGYTNGKSGQGETSAQSIVAVVEAFDKLCGDNPDMPAHQAIAQ